MLVKVLAPGYFARQDTKTPVKVGIKAMVTNMVLNLALIVPLAHVGLALATSLSALMNAGLLWFGLRKEGVYQAQPGWWLFCARLGVASTLMVVAIVTLNKDLAQWLAWGWQQRSGYLALLVVAGMGAYFGGLLLMGMRPQDLRTRHEE